MKKIAYMVILSMSAISCRKAYNPPVVAGNANYLVVEGIINTGPDSTIINLSRTVNLSQKIVNNPELNATVTVESDQNGSFPLQAVANGMYVSPGLNLDDSRMYRLRINTADGKTYLSDFGTPKISPPIDSVGVFVQPKGLQIYLSTHDPSNNTRYYLWVYNETWLFHPYFTSYYIISGDSARLRTASEDVYTCFATDTTSTIVINSSAKLTKDVIYQTPITFLPSTSEKIEDRYSINIKQYAITPAAYNYYQLLKTNTENLGTIFDAQPSQLPGNIHEVGNPAEPVIGYISVGTVAQKRIFIDNRNLPAWLPITYYDAIGCFHDTLNINSVAQFDYYYLHKPPYFIPSILPNKGVYAICADCTLRGTKITPPFWK
jgi:hypothetical protein